MTKASDFLMACAQIAFTTIILLMIGAMMIIFEIRPTQLSGPALEIFKDEVATAKEAVMLVLFFWFQRQRQGGLDAPMVTHTTTAPDGTVTHLSYPASVPAPVPFTPSQPTTK